MLDGKDINLFYQKRGNSWEVYDKDGKRAIGPTKELARRKYYLLHHVNLSPGRLDTYSKVLDNIK